MAIGLGGLYLLVRVRSEVHGDDRVEESPAAHDTVAPAGDGVDLAGWGHTFPHSKNPPEWVTNGEIWERAKQRVRPYWHEYHEPWAVVAHVYEQMGGRAA
jgi:hypothetical protein